ncbi:MAG: hypothetical protein KatS3mg077_2730 [Candidatus Binatia bacterium]|nr:MAG: hypothetical protein KatS3mg077_2730 [Candidatus Binatia bacterium]
MNREVLGPSASPVAPVTFVQLLRPRMLSARNRYRRAPVATRWQRVFLASLALAFGLGVFLFFYRVLLHFLSVPEFGPILTYKLLAMVLLTFLSILLFSNIIVVLSTFFLSAEMDRLVAAPVRWSTLFHARFVETIVESSWMIVLFALPAFLAYGLAHQAGAAFYLAAALVLVPFSIVPASVGVVLTAVLVNVFPARQARDLLVLVAIVAGAILYISLRFLEPERLVRPDEFADFAAFLVAMRNPSAIWLPSTWAAEILHGLAVGSTTRVPLWTALLLASAAVSWPAACWATGKLFSGGYSKSQEGRRAHWTQDPAAAARILDTLLSPLPRVLQLWFRKDTKTFFRDASQWSQLILLLALVVVYVYNFRVLQFGSMPLVTFYFRNVVSFLNLLLAGFVVASVAQRFVFPAISLEGRALWIAQTAPIDLRQLWWSKFWVNLVPLLVLGEVLIVLTNHYLRVLPFMRWLAPMTMVGLITAIVAISLAAGTRYPRFEADHATKIATSAGALISMILCMTVVGSVVVLQAWPTYVLLMNSLQGAQLDRAEWVGVVASLAASAAVMAVAIAEAVRRGLRAMDEFGTKRPSR